MVVSVIVDTPGNDEWKQESNLLSSHKYFTIFGVKIIDYTLAYNYCVIFDAIPSIAFCVISIPSL